MSGVGQAAFILLPGPAHEQSFLVAVGPVPVFISRVTARVAGAPPHVYSHTDKLCSYRSHGLSSWLVCG